MTFLDSAPEDVFASGAYWREYYAELGHENAAAGEFLHEIAGPLARRRRLRVLAQSRIGGGIAPKHHRVTNTTYYFPAVV